MPETDLPVGTEAEAAGAESQLAKVMSRLGYDTADWPSLQQRLAKRSIDPLTNLLDKPKSEPLLWGLPADLQAADLADLTARLAKAAAGKNRSVAWAAEALPNWLDEAAGRSPDLAHAVECLAWCRASRRLAGEVEPSIWLELLNLLLNLQDDAAAIELEKSPLLHQLIAGELAVTLAYQFPDIKPLRSRAKKGRSAIAAGIMELLDGEGLPQAVHLHLLRPLVACWTRSAAICRKLREPLLREETADGYAWAVQQMVRLTRGDRGQLLDADRHLLTTDFAKAAAKIAVDDECTTAAALAGLLGKKAAGKASGYEAPEAGTESEWSAVAVLRSDWTPRAAAVAVEHPGSDLRVEMSLGSQVLFSGMLNPLVQIDGQEQCPGGDWEQICWYSDDDGDYLELELALESGWRIQRQTMLARTDGFVLLADAVLCPENDADSHTIGYRLALPLADGLSYQPAEETAEGMIADPAGKPLTLALPLALPEWRSGSSRGKLQLEDDRRLVLSQTHTGSRMLAPLLLDYYPKRMRKQLTWRQLTVAEQLQIQPADAAVGYRVQLGLEQWLIYRSLAPQQNRTVLGHNLTSEFLVARFDDGEVEPLVEIE